MKPLHFKWMILSSLILNLLSQALAQTQNINTPSTAPTTGNEEIYQGLVMGVGPGTVAVCAFGIIGLIICFFKDCTQTPALMVTVGIILPLLVLLIVWFIPKQDLRTDTQKEAKLPTDSYKIRTGIFSALIFLVCFFVSLLMCFGKITTVIGQRVDSELADINNAKRLKNI